jgi:Trk K+ transport system NAD-binding subunit
LAEIPWPEGCLVTTLRRGWNVMIPRGNTRLEKGDRLVLIAEKNAESTIRQLVEGQK